MLTIILTSAIYLLALTLTAAAGMYLGMLLGSMLIGKSRIELHNRLREKLATRKSSRKGTTYSAFFIA